jgi:TonB family protein
MKPSIALTAVQALILVCACICSGAQLGLASPKFTIGTQESSTYYDAEALVCPHPEIPPELHEQCFKSCCIARFIIKADGKSSVKLLSSSGSAQVDDIALSTLQRWRFRPAMLNGKPVQSTRKIRVEFEVE